MTRGPHKCHLTKWSAKVWLCWIKSNTKEKNEWMVELTILIANNNSHVFNQKEHHRSLLEGCIQWSQNMQSINNVDHKILKPTDHELGLFHIVFFFFQSRVLLFTVTQNFHISISNNCKSKHTHKKMTRSSCKMLVFELSQIFKGGYRKRCQIRCKGSYCLEFGHCIFGTKKSLSMHLKWVTSL